MAKDKKKKKKDKKNGSAASAASTLKALAANPLVADVVAAALVATASALKDSNKARRLAEEAGDEVETLAKEGAERGNALWQLALDVGRHALDTLSEDKPAKPRKAGGAKKPKRAAVQKR